MQKSETIYKTKRDYQKEVRNNRIYTFIAALVTPTVIYLLFCNIPDFRLSVVEIIGMYLLAFFIGWYFAIYNVSDLSAFFEDEEEY